jgi:1,4-alpha-glucan branching enzyme
MFLFSRSVFSRENNDITLAVPDTGPQWKIEWARGAVFYEIFVRSFSDSNGDGIGDINGLISNLDYLNDGKAETGGDLGIDGIWLMPVFRSPSYHGYDVTDYRHINPDYGTDEDFERLLAANGEYTYHY